jgi:hypothetical protein
MEQLNDLLKKIKNTVSSIKSKGLNDIISNVSSYNVTDAVSNDKNNNQHPKYTELFEKLDTLDIMLFRGQNYWFSYAVEFLTWSEFSHVGIVLKSPTYISPELTGVYLLESGSENFPDAQDHKQKFGVQISDLAKILDNYDGKVYYRKMRQGNSMFDLLDLDNDINERQNYLNSKLALIYKEVYDKPYDDLVFDLLRCEIHVPVGNCRSDKRFFCSALVAYVYLRLGFLPEDTQWDLISPKHFGVKQLIDEKLVNGKLGILQEV